MKIDQVLLKPILTEKATQMTGRQVYTFLVDPAASKTQIRERVEKIFSVKVTSVKTVLRKGKNRKAGRRMVIKKLPDKKIAYVKLKSGKINLFPQA